MVRAPSDALLVFQVTCLAVVVPLLMRLPLDRLEQLLEPKRSSHRIDTAYERHLLALVDLVLDLGRPVLRPDCRMRGITRYWVLRRAGVDVGLAFGVGRPSTEVAGHCWLVRGGVPYLERHDPRPIFTEMLRFNAAPSGQP
jgi:hypothetical protein